MSDFKILSKEWNYDDQIRFEALLPIAAACVSRDATKAPDKTSIGRAIVRIAYGMVFAEKELRGEWTDSSIPQPAKESK